MQKKRIIGYIVTALLGAAAAVVGQALNETTIHQDVEEALLEQKEDEE